MADDASGAVKRAPQVNSSPLGCCDDRKRENGKLLFGGAAKAFSILQHHGSCAVGSEKIKFRNRSVGVALLLADCY